MRSTPGFRRKAQRGTVMSTSNSQKICAVVATMSFAISAFEAGALEPIGEREAEQIAVEAYLYFYPLVTMDVTLKVMTNVEASRKPGAGPMNQFSHLRAFPPVEMRDVVRPNFDTLYSIAWLDLTKEPVILSAPDTKDRYYLLPLMDMWTDVFAVPGKRTSGTAAHHFAIVPQHWSGRLPGGMEKIEAPTPYVWILGRTQTDGPKDYDAVHQIQNDYKITPLSQWGKAPKPAAAKIDSSVDTRTPPLEQVNSMPAARFFPYAAELMKANPPHLTDWSQIERMKRIGLEPGKSFDFDKTDPTIKRALEKAVTDGLAAMKAKAPTLAPAVNGWQMNTHTMGVYGDYYLKRAIIAMVGLGANQPEDAIYPLALADGEGKPLDGTHNYALHFAKNELPPAEAFWSITLYDDEGFQVANPLNRFALGDRDALRYNGDGSLDLHIQNANPGPDKESNWLPSPKEGGENITMRLYAPKPEALDGRWVPPPIKRVN
jgi:hypothetical protein